MTMTQAQDIERDLIEDTIDATDQLKKALELYADAPNEALRSSLVPAIKLHAKNVVELTGMVETAASYGKL